MSEFDISLPEIESALDNLRQRLTFQPKVEAFYEEQTKHLRAKVLCQIGLLSLFVYNLLILVDSVLLPDTFWLATALHFGIVTPVALAASLIIIANPRLIVRETLAVLAPVLMFAQIMTSYCANRGEAADNYQYLSILAIILMNAIQRTDYRFAVGTSALLAGIYFVVIWGFGHSPIATQLVGSVFMTTAVFATLMARRLMERDARTAFLRQSQDRLQHDAVEALSKRDGLTGLSNRRHLEEHIEAIWSQPDDSVSPVAALMIDVDCFKAFNDRYGHLSGDLCLTRVASAIVAQLTHKDDIAVRFGGEEFLVLLVQTSFVEAVGIAERIRQAIRSLGIPHECSPYDGVVTASCGVTAGSIAERQASDLIADADSALYAAKRAGRDRVWPSLSTVEALTATQHAILQAS